MVEVTDETASVLVVGSRIASYGGEEGEAGALRLLVDLELVDGDRLASDFTAVARPAGRPGYRSGGAPSMSTGSTGGLATVSRRVAPDDASRCQRVP